MSYVAADETNSASNVQTSISHQGSLYRATGVLTHVCKYSLLQMLCGEQLYHILSAA